MAPPRRNPAADVQKEEIVEKEVVKDEEPIEEVVSEEVEAQGYVPPDGSGEGVDENSDWMLSSGDEDSMTEALIAEQGGPADLLDAPAVIGTPEALAALTELPDTDGPAAMPDMPENWEAAIPPDTEKPVVEEQVAEKPVVVEETVEAGPVEESEGNEQVLDAESEVAPANIVDLFAQAATTAKAAKDSGLKHKTRRGTRDRIIEELQQSGYIVLSPKEQPEFDLTATEALAQVAPVTETPVEETPEVVAPQSANVKDAPAAFVRMAFEGIQNIIRTSDARVQELTDKLEAKDSEQAVDPVEAAIRILQASKESRA